MAIVDTALERRTRSDRRGASHSPLVGDLRTAIERGAIEILFQPQFAVDDTIIGAEALARWSHPDVGPIAPDRLFAIAEAGGLIGRLSCEISRLALQEAGEWPVPLRLSLNVTAADLAVSTFVSGILRTAEQAGFAPELLTLEITEHALVSDLDRTTERLRQLADFGTRFALDDFGAGFCNFEYLKRLPLHYLKLDRAMVKGIDEDPRDLAVLRGIVAMARALDLELVAEGIERETQRTTIIREGCSTWQGFLGAAPMRAPDFRQMLIPAERLG